MDFPNKHEGDAKEDAEEKGASQIGVIHDMFVQLLYGLQDGQGFVSDVRQFDAELLKKGRLVTQVSYSKGGKEGERALVMAGDGTA